MTYTFWLLRFPYLGPTSICIWKMNLNRTKLHFMHSRNSPVQTVDLSEQSRQTDPRDWVTKYPENMLVIELPPTIFKYSILTTTLTQC